MSYCLNSACPHPENLAHTEFCQACGSALLLRDRYRVIRALGHGGFGATFLAIDESLPGHPNCVIKQLRPAASSPHVLKMARDLFDREAKTLGKIGDHPQVPRLLDYFDANQEFYLVQEFISGSTLQQEVKRSGPFSEAGVKQFLSEVLPMLQYIHSQQVIHRDIKPANLIRRYQDKKLVLIDFGAVKDRITPTRAGASEQTALTAYAIGTPGYAPPEQMAMRPTYASDVYALGVTCIYLLTGKAPKDMDYDTATGEVLWQDYVHVSDHFADVLTKMLEVSVRHRYQSAADVLRALDLVPYMDSLAESMVSRPNPPSSKNSDYNSDNLASPIPPSTPTARLAAQIRARKIRNSSGSTSFQVDSSRKGPRSRPSAGSGNSSGRTNKPTSTVNKLDEQQILDAYAKGHRNFAQRDLSLLNLQEAQLSGANFHQANLHQAKLSGANFQKADLGEADLAQANLNQASLKDANLVGAFLMNADLGRADLRGANLSYAHLSNTNLRGANLCGADLTGAKVSDAQLAMARTNWKTIHPRGKRLW